MGKEPRWVPRLVVDALHLDLVREHGGLQGARDPDALEAALARPRHRWALDEASDIASLAAAYGFGLARDHPYHDGNKPIAFVTMGVFLGMNGLRLQVTDEEVVAVMLELAAGALTEDALARWIRARTVPR